MSVFFKTKINMTSENQETPSEENHHYTVEMENQNGNPSHISQEEIDILFRHIDQFFIILVVSYWIYTLTLFCCRIIM